MTCETISIQSFATLKSFAALSVPPAKVEAWSHLQFKPVSSTLKTVSSFKPSLSIYALKHW